MKLSIIICVYNTAKEYLDECLSSIRNSTLEAVDYEICMVDDGSEIDYSELIAKWGVRCEKTENRGILAARLKGIDMAAGEYIAFVDSDDTVSFNYHAPMILCAEETGADIVYNDWAFRSRNTRYYCKGDSTISGNVSADGDDVLLSFVRHEGRQHAYYVLWNKLYRAELVKRLPKELMLVGVGEERFNYSEDALMNFHLHKWANCARGVHTGYYFYRTHAAQSVEVTSFGKLRAQIRQMSYTLSHMQTNIGKNKNFRRISEHIEGWKRLMSRSHYSHARAHGYFELYDYIRERYGTERLRRAIPQDTKAYERTVLLGENFVEIDGEMLSLFRAEKMVSLTIPKDRYAKFAVSYLIKHGALISTVHQGDITLPRERIPFIKRMIFNSLLRKIGMLIVPKGSRLRAWLKKKA